MHYYEKLTRPRTNLADCFRQAVDARIQEAADRRKRRNAKQRTDVTGALSLPVLGACGKLNCGCRPVADAVRELEKKLSQAQGEAVKLNALANHEAKREVYVRRARRALLVHAIATGTATADDVRAAVELPPGIDPRCFGVVPDALARKGLIYRTGFVKSTRRERHASHISTWGISNYVGAMQWLVTHPDLPDPTDDDQGGPTVQGFLFPTQETATPTGDAAGAAL